MKRKAFLFCLILFMQTYLFAQKSVVETATINVASYPDLSMDELKSTLLKQAKHQAASKIYGEFLISKTNLQDGKIDNEQIETLSGGIIRLKSTPLYQNGLNLGDIQVTIEAYATEEDIQKYNENLKTQALSVQEVAPTPSKVKKQDFYGEWSGYLMGTNMSSAKVNVSIPTNGHSKIFFPALQCGGDLLILQKDIYSVEFKKLLSFGKENCKDNTRIFLIKKSASQLEYKEYDANQKQIMRGSLYRAD